MAGYIIDYVDENEFKKLERALKKYNMLAYKKLIFEYYPSLQNGEFKGNLKSVDDESKTYELILPSDSMFSKIHGDVKLIYKVYPKEKIVVLKTINPKDVLLDNHKSELTSYKGIMISKSNAEKDKFKIDLLNMLQGNNPQDEKNIFETYYKNKEIKNKKATRRRNKSKDEIDVSDIFDDFIEFDISKHRDKIDYSKMTTNEVLLYKKCIYKQIEIISKKLNDNNFIEFSKYYDEFESKDNPSISKIKLMSEIQNKSSIKVFRLFGEYYFYIKKNENIKKYIDKVINITEINIKNDIINLLKEKYLIQKETFPDLLISICDKYKVSNYIDCEAFINKYIENKTIKEVSIDIENKKEYVEEEQEQLDEESRLDETLYYVLYENHSKEYLEHINDNKLVTQNNKKTSLNQYNLDKNSTKTNNSGYGCGCIIIIIIIVYILIIILESI